MLKCIELASKGIGNVAPNPMVGCVIVHNNQIIGSGYHQKYGEAHAEVNAINSVSDKSLLKDSTLYVNLEPCSHTGKTPPCADLIIANKIPKVIIGQIDPNPEVSGKGIEKLKNAGIEVEVGVSQEDCKNLNKRFNTFHEKHRPYIILKWAQTIDGFIDKIRQEGDTNEINWISTLQSRVLVHKWRTEEQSILIGTNTALIDNPKLNARLFEGKNPLRIVLDKELSLPKNLNIFDNTIKTIVFTEKESVNELNIEYETIKFDGNLITSILNNLYKRKIQSIIIEGGAFTLNSFIKNNIWDEARVFEGNINFNNGIKAPIINGNITSEFFIDSDLLKIVNNL